MPIGITSKYRFLIPSLYIDSEFRKKGTNIFEKIILITAFLFIVQYKDRI